uniref:Corrinoid protein n=1 Tax=Clostridioides difficile TaxID=1496 RepID=A0A381IAL4_CLODI|nr:corrinoid protein [Clostridioides difficile]
MDILDDIAECILNMGVDNIENLVKIAIDKILMWKIFMNMV